MSFPSYYIEMRKYSKKNLIINYQIEKISLSILGKIVNMNNWLTFKDWLEVYEKLESILEKESNKTNENNCLYDFDRIKFFVSNNSIQVEVVKEKFQSIFSELFQIRKEKFHNVILHIYINVSANHIQKECSVSDKIKKENGSHSKSEKEHEPYKPSKSKINKHHKSKDVKYTPSQISQEEPYTPQPVSIKEESISPDIFCSQKTPNSLDNFPIYKPSPIGPISNENDSQLIKNESSQQSEKSIDKVNQVQRETRSKKRFSNHSSDDIKVNTNNQQLTEVAQKISKRKHLFGSDDSDAELEGDRNKKVEKNFKADIRVSIPKLTKKSKTIHKFKDKVTNLTNSKDTCSKRNLENKDITKYLSLYKPIVSTHRRNEIQTIVPPALSSEELEVKRAQHQKDVQAITQLNNIMKSAFKSPKNVVIKTLNHLSVDYVLSTFKKHNKILNTHFDNFKLSKQRNVPKIEDLDYMALQNFIPEQHLLEMCTFLREKYESADGVPQFTDLYMNLLIPEWFLAIYMEEHSMNRQQALQQILDQEESSIPTQICTQMIDNSFLNISS